MIRRTVPFLSFWCVTDGSCRKDRIIVMLARALYMRAKTSVRPRILPVAAPNAVRPQRTG